MLILIEDLDAYHGSTNKGAVVCSAYGDVLAEGLTSLEKSSVLSIGLQYS